MELLIEVIDWELLKIYALYDNFMVENEAASYPLKSLGRNRGIIGDYWKNQIGAKFSTADNDHTGCATSLGGYELILCGQFEIVCLRRVVGGTRVAIELA